MKNETSKRGLVLCDAAIDSLKRQRIMQQKNRETAGPPWTENGLVFTTVTGGPMDDNLVRKLFRKALAQVPGCDPDEGRPGTCGTPSSA